jgi:hypothetical protein
MLANHGAFFSRPLGRRRTRRQPAATMGGEGRSWKHCSSPSSGGQRHISSPRDSVDLLLMYGVLILCSRLVQARKRGGSVRDAARRRTGGAVRTIGMRRKKSKRSDRDKGNDLSSFFSLIITRHWTRLLYFRLMIHWTS